MNEEAGKLETCND